MFEGVAGGSAAGSTDQGEPGSARPRVLVVDDDAALAEINPLILEGNGHLKALDAKFTFDSNALLRHPEIVACRDLDEEDAAEIEASKFDLSYISLEGNIGCLVNGAGLAMATMDTIKLFGGEPANFLDVGGGATPETVKKAFEILLADPKVKSIFINIFGGIMRCDYIAEGVIKAAQELNMNIPLVVRLKGTKEAEAKAYVLPPPLCPIHTNVPYRMIKESGLKIIAHDGLDEAAEQAVQLAV